MLKISFISGVNKISHIIYENEQEFAMSGLVCAKDLQSCKEGQYILTNNGYYIPLLKFEVIKKGHVGDMVKYHFPRLAFVTMIYYDSKKERRQRPLVWDRDVKHRKPAVFVTARQKLMALYLSQGMDIYQAFHMVYAIKNRTRREQRIKEIIENPNFVKYMFESGIMETAKKVFANKGVDNAWLAEQLKRMVEDGLAHPTLRIKALTMVDLILNKGEQDIANGVEESPLDDLREKFNLTKVI